MILMCNKGIADSSIDQQRRHGSEFLMDGHSSASNSPLAGASPGSNDDAPRVKFLCSFSGSILPRPQDGKLRYVGGDTRIVSVSRDIGYEELMAKMRELYDGTAVLKYQQPDEDLDALVSVVNDEDVINMMEEYDKLGSGDGFTRLRIFLFSQPESDVSSHYDGDEREGERRYVDALNNLNDGPDFRSRQLRPESPVMSPVDDLHAAAEQYFNSLSLESGGVHGQRNYEVAMPQYNLRHLSIPHMGSGHQHLPMVNQRYNDVETPWSPAYYSPGHHGHEPRPIAEFPSSPSSARFHMAFGELPADRFLDRMPEEYSRQQLSQQQPPFEPQTQYPESVAAWMQTGGLPGDKSALPGNLFHGHSAGEGSSICEHCRMAFHRNFDHPGIGNGLHQVPNLCPDCPTSRESFMLNADAKLHHGFYPNEQSTDHRSLYTEALGHERGWILQQQLNARADETRASVSGSLRTNDHYPVDGVSMNLPHGHGNVVDSRPMSSNYLYHRAGYEIGNGVFHDQTMVGPPHIHAPSEESGMRYGNLPFPLVGENLYPTHGHVPGQPFWRNIQNPAHIGQSYEACNSLTQGSGKVNPGLPRSPWEGSPRLCVGIDNQNTRVESSKTLPFEGKVMPEYAHDHGSRVNSTTLVQEHQQPVFPDPVQLPSDMVKHTNIVEEKEAMPGQKSITDEEKEAYQAEKAGTSDCHDVSSSEVKTAGDNDGNILSSESINSSCLKPADKDADVLKQGDMEYSASEDPNFAEKLSFLPEMIASAKKAALDGASDMKVKVEEGTDAEKNGSIAQELANELESVTTPMDTELDSDSDAINVSRIEPTKAEAEAIDNGLQTIRNDDLEEIRELGSGTYGAVYHGKWRGSDVAIKRIKASCFAGRPPERERLIADFWKEALILSSLHHPNVVSFYGIVRDGPDGTLATVTEFMVNGSLKQFLQKKDRTIDRRKRLIIAMDAAFGMEYLHGKNIVHFDLKCENLLVNMRDPQRPVCKIGDLGLSKVKQHTLVSGGVRGTLPWMAPELLSGKSNMVTEKIDVYSFGIVMWELLTGEEPYADLHCASIIGGIVNNTLRPQIPTWCDPEWKSLMESCWASDPALRPSFSEISQKLRNIAAAMNLK